jgi:hypothetical protein
MAREPWQIVKRAALEDEWVNRIKADISRPKETLLRIAPYLQQRVRHQGN